VAKKNKSKTKVDKDLMEFEGEIIDVLPNQMFKVKLDDNDYEITAYTGGKMKQFKIRMVHGDRVKVEMSPYDLTKGRIIFRM
jgi:translation initiation factor IF-1